MKKSRVIGFLRFECFNIVAISLFLYLAIEKLPDTYYIPKRKIRRINPLSSGWYMGENCGAKSHPEIKLSGNFARTLKP